MLILREITGFDQGIHHSEFLQLLLDIQKAGQSVVLWLNAEWYGRFLEISYRSKWLSCSCW